MRRFGIAGIRNDLAALLTQIRPERCALVAVIDGLNGLLERDGDEQTDDDGRNVNEKVFPGMDRLVRSVNIEHRRRNLPSGI